MERRIVPADIDAVVRRLPMSPTVLARLGAMLKSEESSTVDVILAVRTDPSLAAMVLKVGRSALFGPPEPPETIDEAVVRIGFHEVSRIVSYAVMRQLAESLPLYGESADFFWRKSVACAFAMEVLAARAHQPVESAYLVGLLHGIGAVLLQRAAASLGLLDPAIDALAPESVLAQEARLLGMHQGRAAAQALIAWHFSPAVARPIELQFEPEQAGKYSPIAHMLVQAKHLSLAALDRPDLAAVFAGPPADEVPALVAEVRDDMASVEMVSAAIS